MESESEELFRLIPIPMSATFIQALDANLKRLGYASRAQFLRDAAFEKATTLGVKIPRESTLGGRVNATIADVEAATQRPKAKRSKTPKSAAPNFDDPKVLQAAADLAALVAGPPSSGKSPPLPKAASTSDSAVERGAQNRGNNNLASNVGARAPRRREASEKPTDLSP